MEKPIRIILYIFKDGINAIKLYDPLSLSIYHQHTSGKMYPNNIVHWRKSTYDYQTYINWLHYLKSNYFQDNFK